MLQANKTDQHSTQMFKRIQSSLLLQLTLALYILFGATLASAQYPKSLLIYNAYPRSINQNGAGTVAGASSELGQYDYLVLSAEHEKSYHWDYANTVAILAHPDLANTTVFGEVSVGVNVVNHPIAEIKTRINEWKIAGAEGISFSHFGYNWGGNRDRQNEAIDYAHSQNMLVLAEAFFPADAFGAVVDPLHNPNGIETSLNASDFYLYEAHQVAGGAIYEGFIWQDKANQIQAYRDDIGFGIFSYTTNSETTNYDEAAFFYSWYSALLYGHEATGWGEYAYSGWSASAEQAPYRNRPLINSGTVFTGDVLNPEAGLYTRTTDLGIVSVNTTTHAVSFLDPASSSPQLAALGNEEIEAEATRYITISANDPDGTIPALSATSLPAFASFTDHGTGTATLALTPGAADEGSYAIEFTAIDAVDPSLTDSQTLTLTVTAADLNPKSLLIYNAYPRSINQNGAGTVAGASNELGQYDYLVLSANHEQPTHWDYANTAAILAHSDLANTTVFGEVSIGVNVINHPLSEIQTRIDQWKNTGVEGIFLNHFGYNWGADRQRQNDAIDYARSQGLLVLIEAFYPEQAFGNAIDPTHNPSGLATHLNSSDIYLYDAHIVANGDIYPDFIWQDKVNQLQTYQDDIGFDIFSYTTNSETTNYDEAAFFYSWYSALLYGHKATGWGEYAYSGWGASAEQAPLRIRPATDAGTIYTSSVENPAPGIYRRLTDTGVIAVNTNTHEGWISHNAPVANGENYSVNEDAILTIATPGLLTNDSDADGDALTAVKVDDPMHGSVYINPDGSFTYAPDPDFSGSDSFSYQAVDAAYSASDPVDVTITVHYGDGVQPDNLSPKTLLIYYGWTSKVNGTSSVSEASAVFGAYDYVIFGGGIEQVNHPEHQYIADILAHPNMVNTTAFGYIELGLKNRPADKSVEEIKMLMEKWQSFGMDGIFLDEFDYGGITDEDPGVTRQRQNAVVAHAHSLNMPVVANAFVPESAFSNALHPIHNPTGEAALLDSNDFYLYESHQVGLSEYTPAFIWTDKADRLKAYHDQIGFHILANTTVDDGNVYDENAFFYSWYSALLYGHEAIAWGEACYAACEPAPDLAPFRTPVNIDPGTVFTSEIQSHSNGLYTRQTDIGTIAVHVFDNNEMESIYADNGSIQEGWISYHPPVGNADTYSVDEDNNLVISAPGVLINDSDADNELFTAVKLTGPAHGVVQLQADGSFVYVPQANFSGIDSFTYQARDRSYVTSDTVTVTITVNYVDGVQPESLSPKSLLIYNAYPRSINQATPGSGSVESASTELGQYDYLMLGREHERPYHWDYANTAAILAHPNMANTTVFGEVSIDSTFFKHPMDEIKTRIDQWKTIGAEGILFTRFGYNDSTSRARQNEAVDYARSQNLLIAVDAFYPQQVFGSDVDPVFNPDGIATSLDSTDFYLYDAHQLMNGQIYEGFIWDGKASLIESYRDQIGFGLFSYTNNSDTTTYDENAFFYSWYSALLYGHEATGWAEFAQSAWGASTEKAPYRQHPQIDPGTEFLGDVVKPQAGGSIYTRQTDTGVICVNTLTHEYAFIPANQQNQDAKLLASNGGAGDRFGSALAQFGDRIVVGAYENDDQSAEAGAAYVYHWDGAHWQMEAQLYAADAAAGNNFGYSVAIDSTRILVGARYDDANGTHAGSAYVFELDDGTWSQTAKLLPNDGVADAEFGDEVELGSVRK